MVICMVICMVIWLQVWLQVCRAKTISKLQVFAASRIAKTISKTQKLQGLFAFRAVTRISCRYQAQQPLILLPRPLFI
jgi:hypothetical protein